ncbi:MAG: phosphoadenylyl-sulfate reductase [Bacteroidota bacterium]
MNLATKHDIKTLNDIYRPLSVEQRIRRLYEDFPPEEVMLTSSFATTSALLLSLFARVRPEQEIFFIDTGYHFEETLQYKDELTELLDINVTSVHPDPKSHAMTQNEETWKKDPNYCCFLNKVSPLEDLKLKYSVWISGLMRWQSDHRSTLDIFEERNGILKFYPLIDVTKEERSQRFDREDLPKHPLVFKGYASIGCKHCTVPGDDRNGRWNNSPKTECGLHL